MPRTSSIIYIAEDWCVPNMMGNYSLPPDCSVLFVAPSYINMNILAGYLCYFLNPPHYLPKALLYDFCKSTRSTCESFLFLIFLHQLSKQITSFHDQPSWHKPTWFSTQMFLFLVLVFDSMRGCIHILYL